MKYKNLFRRSALPAALISAMSGVTPVILDPPPTDNPNHFSLGYRMAFDVGVDFKHVGAFTPPGLLRQTPAGDPFNYDDGYVLPDSSSAQTGYTRYWGYDSQSQLPGNGTILMQRSSSSGASTGDVGDDGPQPGFELTYDRELGRRGNFRWGVEAAFNYMNVCVKDNSPQAVGVSQLTDAYQLPTMIGGGYVVPVQAPHYQGPGALNSGNGDTVIGSTPISSSTQTIAATAIGSREFNADIFGFRLGPYIEMPVTPKWKVDLSAGLALAEVDSQFNYSETISVAGVPPSSGSSSHNAVLVGGYVSGTVSYQLNKNWNAFGGVQFQDLGKYSQNINGREAVLNLSKSTFVSFGVGFSF
jgi:hypothetical protein